MKLYSIFFHPCWWKLGSATPIASYQLKGAFTSLKADRKSGPLRGLPVPSWWPLLRRELKTWRGKSCLGSGSSSIPLVFHSPVIFRPLRSKISRHSPIGRAASHRGTPSCLWPGSGGSSVRQKRVWGSELGRQLQPFPGGKGYGHCPRLFAQRYTSSISRGVFIKLNLNNYSFLNVVICL